MNDAELDFLRDIICKSSGIVLERDKRYLLESRLGPVARREGLEDLSSLVQLLRKQPHGILKNMVVDAMTTNETSFFRDIHPFDALRTQIIPELIKKRAATRSLNIWSAVCSSGQEPYSLAMMLAEHFPELRTWQVRIHGTDLSESMIERAEQGAYSQFEISRGLPAKMLVKYFKKDGDTWRVSPEIRQSVTFKAMNLTATWSAMPVMDVIMIRNVLIYFDNETKSEVLRKACRNLQPDGYLFLGGAESLLSLSIDLQRTKVAESWCYRPTTGVPA